MIDYFTSQIASYVKKLHDDKMMNWSPGIKS